MKLIKFLLNIAILLLCSATIAKTNISLPYFGSIKTKEAKLRQGPGMQYNTISIFIKKNEPIEIIAEFDNWKKIRDITGEEGWMNTNLISSQRFVVTKNTDPAVQKSHLYSSADVNSKSKAKVHNNVRCKLLVIKPQWCKVKCHNIEGWILKDNLWGTYNDEESLLP